MIFGKIFICWWELNCPILGASPPTPKNSERINPYPSVSPPLVFPGSETRGGGNWEPAAGRKFLGIWRCLMYWKPFRNVFSGSKNVFLDGRSPKKKFACGAFGVTLSTKNLRKKNHNLNFAWNAQKWGFSRAAGENFLRSKNGFQFSPPLVFPGSETRGGELKDMGWSGQHF